MSTRSEDQRAYWNERLREHWGPEGAGSTVFGRQFNSWRYRMRRLVFRRLVRRLALRPAELAVLDVGCGTGFYLEQWRSLGVRSLTGLDISDWSIAQLAKSFPEAMLYRADVGEPAFQLPAEAFDVVTALDVLVHVVDDAAYLRALEHIGLALKPGGYLFYSDVFFGGTAKQFRNYWKGRALSEVVQAMVSCGLEVVERVPMAVLMNDPANTGRKWMERIWERAMLPVRRSEYVGFVMGAMLFPLEWLLVSTMKRSPSIEIMVCRKSGAKAALIRDSADTAVRDAGDE